MLNYLDLPFSDEERLVQQTTREWVEAEAAPGALYDPKGTSIRT